MDTADLFEAQANALGLVLFLSAVHADACDDQWEEIPA